MSSIKNSHRRSDSIFDLTYVNSNYLSDFQKSDSKFHEYDLKKKMGTSKGSIFYNTHSYPTKVPVDSIVARILENTKKGQTVLDPFCGSGMTGLAAKLSGRNAFLSDIGSLAIHLASNHVSFCDIDDLKKESKRILLKLEESSPYFVFHEGKESEVSHVIYANIYKCPKCRKHISSWDLAKQTKSFSVPSKISCTSCSSIFGKQDLNCIGKKAVSASLSVGRGRNVSVEMNREPVRTRVDSFRVSRRVELMGATQFDENREMHIRSALHLQNVYSLRDFYSDVNWFALGSLFEEISSIKNLRTKAALLFAFTNTAWHGSKMRRFNSKGGHRPLTGTLYFPQLYSEGNVFRVFENKIETLVKYYSELKRYGTNSHIQIDRHSAVNLSLEDNSIDYIYTDPPFGSNIFYADCNFIAEAWLGSLTSIANEAVVNRSLKEKAGGKSLDHYAHLMRASFLEMNRVLKKGSALSLVFNSSTGDVWQALMDSLNDAGFEVADADLLDKVQLSFKGYKGKSSSENVATTDLVIDLKKKSKRANVRKDQKMLQDSEILKAWRLYQTDHDSAVGDTSKFYSYLLKFCHLNGYSFIDVDLSRIKSVVSEPGPDVAA